MIVTESRGTGGSVSEHDKGRKRSKNKPEGSTAHGEQSGQVYYWAERVTRDELFDLFRRSGALLEGHFRLSSGLHSSAYLQSALVLQYPAHAETLGRALAECTRNLAASVVVSPALGGVIIG